VVDLRPAGEVCDENDVVLDIMTRVREMFTADAAQLQELEAGVRRDWGGERPYIAKLGESARAARSWRDERIRSEYRRGERSGYLARKWGISERRVRQIVGEES